MSDHDPHEIKMSVGTASLAMVDAIDEDFMTYLGDACEPLTKAFKHLTDAGVDERGAISALHGFVAALIDDVRG